jgi:hypothetical protein
MSDVTRSSMKMPLVVRMSGDLRDQVAALATREERSLSSMFRQLVRRGLDAGKPPRKATQPAHRQGRGRD